MVPNEHAVQFEVKGVLGSRICFFLHRRSDARRLQIKRPWYFCLCGQLKQRGDNSSRPQRGHLWYRLTNVSLLRHKDTRLTKLAINAPLYHTLICQPSIYRLSVLHCITMFDKTGSHFQVVLQEGSPWGTIRLDSFRILIASSSSCSSYLVVGDSQIKNTGILFYLIDL